MQQFCVSYSTYERYEPMYVSKPKSAARLPSMAVRSQWVSSLKECLSQNTEYTSQTCRFMERWAKGSTTLHNRPTAQPCQRKKRTTDLWSNAELRSAATSRRYIWQISQTTSPKQTPSHLLPNWKATCYCKNMCLITLLQPDVQIRYILLVHKLL